MRDSEALSCCDGGVEVAMLEMRCWDAGLAVVCEVAGWTEGELALRTWGELEGVEVAGGAMGLVLEDALIVDLEGFGVGSEGIYSLPLCLDQLHVLGGLGEGMYHVGAVAFPCLG